MSPFQRSFCGNVWFDGKIIQVFLCFEKDSTILESFFGIIRWWCTSNKAWRNRFIPRKLDLEKFQIFSEFSEKSFSELLQKLFWEALLNLKLFKVNKNLKFVTIRHFWLWWVVTQYQTFHSVRAENCATVINKSPGGSVMSLEHFLQRTLSVKFP